MAAEGGENYTPASMVHMELAWRAAAWDNIVEFCGRTESPSITRWLTSTEAEQSSDKTADASDLAAQADPTVFYEIGSIPLFEGHVLGLTAPGRTRIRVVRGSALDLARDFIKKGGCWPLVVNMASMAEPGGDVTRGGPGQEEELFRRTNYHKTLKRNVDGQVRYPMATTVAYSPRVTVLTDSDYTLLPEPFPVSILACPYPRDPPLDPKREAYAERASYSDMSARVRAIFRLGVLYSHNVIIAGPLGCEPRGGHPARQIAEFFIREVVENDGKFREIVLAFPPDVPDETFHIFDELLTFTPSPVVPAARREAAGEKPPSFAGRRLGQSAGRGASDSDLTPKKGRRAAGSPPVEEAAPERPASAGPAPPRACSEDGSSASREETLPPASLAGEDRHAGAPQKPPAPARQKVRRRLSDIRPIRIPGKPALDRRQSGPVGGQGSSPLHSSVAATFGESGSRPNSPSCRNCKQQHGEKCTTDY